MASRSSIVFFAGASAVALLGGCRKKQAAEPLPAASAPAAGSALGATPISSLRRQPRRARHPRADDAPRLAATVIAATIYKLPNIESRKLGYLRLGGIVQRDAEPGDRQRLQGRVVPRLSDGLRLHRRGDDRTSICRWCAPPRSGPT